MVKRNVNGRKSHGTAGIAIVEEPAEFDQEVEVGHHAEEATTPKKERKAKAESQADGSFGYLSRR